MPTASIAQYGLSTYTESSYQRPGSYSVFPYKAEGDGVHDRQVPHRHDFYQMIWLSEGAGTLRCDLNEWPFSQGALFFAVPGRLHCWQPALPTRGIAVGFTDEFLNGESAQPDLVGRLSNLHEVEKPLLFFTGAERAEMNGLFSVLLAEAAQNDPVINDVVRAYIVIILAKIRRHLRQQAGDTGLATTPNRKPLTLRFRHALEEHFPRLLRVSDYVALLHTSQAQLNQDLRQHTGRTASDHIHDRMLLEAKRLLIHSDGTISEIAYQLGFRDPSYFCRFFRNRGGISPGEYRARSQTEIAAG